MSCCLKNYAKKTVVLTPQRPWGAITPLTPELAKFRKVQKFLGSSLIGIRLYSSIHIVKE